MFRSPLLSSEKVDASTGGAAFSLIELLVVMAILAILMTATAPALSSLLTGSNLNRAGQIVADQMTLARLEAVSKNRDVEVRFYTLSSNVISAVQILRVDEGSTGPVTNVVGRMVRLPDGVAVNPNVSVSPLLSLPTNAGGVIGTTNLPAYGAVSYKGFRIRANGMMDNNAGGNSSNFVTLQGMNPPPTSAPPANYYTLQINPVTGKVITYRP